MCVGRRRWRAVRWGVYFGHHCCLVVGFDALGIWHFWIFTLFHPFLLLLHTFFSHFHHIYSFSRLIDMVVHFEGACYKTSYPPPHFSGPRYPWVSVLGIGCSTPAPMACNLLPRWLGRLKTRLLHLEYYQDGLRVVNWQCKMESISFAIHKVWVSTTAR